MRTLLLILVLLIFSSTFALDIVIDAQRDPFYDTLTGPGDGWIHIPYTANNDNGTWAEHDDEYDLSANFWCAWDTTYFYFYEEVWDDIVTCENATNHQHDCLELKFDPDPVKGLPVSGSGVYALRLTALDTFDTDGPYSGVDNMYPEGNTEISGFHYTRGVDYERELTLLGYNIEGRLPWEHCYFTSDDRGPVYAAIGEIFGMAVMNHESDLEGTRYGSIEWASHMVDGVWNNVNYHGTMTFLEGNKLSMSTENYHTGLDTNTIDYMPMTGVESSPLQAPEEYELAQNFPNPFNPTTTIEFSLLKQAPVVLKVYDILGNEVAELVNEVKSAGFHSVPFDGAALSSGIYIYRLNNGEQVLTKKMMLVK
ncbi:T9SS type A sorting domain-containing protein [candidate division KSB1 bacterium]|nr:T9SS type A sorting domain-containing protein [candidate division KSB1 bacterium]